MSDSSGSSENCAALLARSPNSYLLSKVLMMTPNLLRVNQLKVIISIFNLPLSLSSIYLADRFSLNGMFNLFARRFSLLVLMSRHMNNFYDFSIQLPVVNRKKIPYEDGSLNTIISFYCQKISSFVYLLLNHLSTCTMRPHR